MAEVKNIVKRSDKVMFYGVPDSSGETLTHHRMEGFTALSHEMNPIEVTRRYVDKTHESTFGAGYSPSISFGCDEFVPDAVLDHLISLMEQEKLGTDAIVTLTQVDFSKTVEDGGYKAWQRTFSVIGETNGDDVDIYTYTGTFKTEGSKVWGKATISEPVGGTPSSAKQIEFTPDEETGM